MRHKWKVAIESSIPYPANTYFGKGVVIAAGGVEYLVNAWVCLNMLRKMGCSLPVEIWYIGEDEYIEEMMLRLEKLGAVCKDITKTFDYPMKGWEVKPHAIVASQFKEVLFLDADNVALCNPEYLFEDPGYKETGALFWPDMEVLSEFNPIWSVLELKPQKLRCQESGQLLIDKNRCWYPLQLCLHMNRESHFYYQHLHGDKDTFQLSWIVLKAPFSFICHLPGVVISSLSKKKNFSSFLQRDKSGRPIFCHSVNCNWFQRCDPKYIWKYYMLPSQPRSQVNPEYPLIRENSEYKSFPDNYPHIEKSCISHWKVVRHLQVKS